MEEITSLGIIEDVLKALEFLHSKGIVHRDVKGTRNTCTAQNLETLR